MYQPAGRLRDWRLQETDAARWSRRLRRERSRSSAGARWLERRRRWVRLRAQPCCSRPASLLGAGADEGGPALWRGSPRLVPSLLPCVPAVAAATVADRCLGFRASNRRQCEILPAPQRAALVRMKHMRFYSDFGTPSPRRGHWQATIALQRGANFMSHINGACWMM